MSGSGSDFNPLSLVAAPVTGLFNVFGAKKQADAARDAATAESSAQKYAADLQSKATADALTFSKQQGENAYQNSEAARQGNYGMYAAAQRRLGSVGSLIGAGPREIPAYVPGVDPNYTGNGAAPAGTAGAPSSGAVPGVDPSKGDLAGQISAYFKSRGVSDQETPYWVQKWGEFGAKDPAYFNSRLAQADIFGQGGTPTAPAGSAASYLQPTKTIYAQVPIAPSLRMPGSAAQYLNG